MKHIKLFENFDNKLNKELLDEYHNVGYIGNYTINENGTIDVDGSVNLVGIGLYKLPLKFGKVAGDFWCSENKLSNLEGCPEYVGGDFDCSDNELTTLNGSPVYVGSTFDCSCNKLTSLEGSPNHVGTYFYCYENYFNSLKGLKCDISSDFFIECKLKIIYDILKDDLECIDNFYDFHILHNLEDVNPTLNLKRLNKFIDLYDLNELTYDKLSELKNYYNVI